MSSLLLQQHWLSSEQAWLKFQQVGPKSKHGGWATRATPHFKHWLWNYTETRKPCPRRGKRAMPLLDILSYGWSSTYQQKLGS